MLREDLIIGLVKEWLAKADEDYNLIKHLMSENAPYLSAITFHAQQAVEKYLKAYLVYHQQEFPKTHDIYRILDIVDSVDKSLSVYLQPTGILSLYSVDVRYPGDYPDVYVEDARRALKLVELAASEIHRQLALV